METKLKTTSFTSYQAFLKNKKRSGTSLAASVSASFVKKKYFSCDILLTEQLTDIPLPREILGNMCIAIVYLPGCDVINFEISCFFYMTKKLRQKFKYLENEKSF